MPNENCLAGMACPKCDDEGPFRIAAQSWFKVYDNGTDEFESVEWDDDSTCICLACDFGGKVKNFKEEDE